MEVAPRIHRIEWPFGERVVCSYLFVGDERVLLVDTGIDRTPHEAIVPYLARIDVGLSRLSYVLISHADLDHMGGNAALKEHAPNALFLCHELDRPMVESVERLIRDRYGEYAADHAIDDSDERKAWIRTNVRPVPIDVGLQGGERLRLARDWRVDVLHTPGHSPGHLSVYDPRSRALVMADAIQWSAVVRRDGTPAFPPQYRSVDPYLASLQRFQGMEIATLLTGHYPVYAGAAVAEFLAESRAFADGLDAATRACLQDAPSPLTTRELIEILSPGVGWWPASANPLLAFPLLGHLERLRRLGFVTTERQNGLIAWRWRKGT
jgi:glyoxylase-like metal-dependent hydrolase (beta-lactamase superfamily II)